MSGAQIGGAIGAVVGFYWGGGNWQLGYAIGSAIGGAVDPTKVYGPKLTDAATQTSSVGVFCPFGYGAFPARGNVIWQGEMSRREHKDDGKGSGTEQITYTYHRSYAIRVCAGTISGYLKIRRNGKTVYDGRTDAELTAEFVAAGLDPGGLVIAKKIKSIRAQNAKFLNSATLYYGDEAQLPDPTIEAAEGVGNVSPFRGRAYIVVNDDDVTDFRGAIPQYDFVVAVDGAQTCDYEGGGVYYAGAYDTTSVGKLFYANSPDEFGSQSYDTGLANDVDFVAVVTGAVYVFDNAGNGRVSMDGCATWKDVTGLPAGRVIAVIPCDTEIVVIPESGSDFYASTDGIGFAARNAVAPFSTSWGTYGRVDYSLVVGAVNEDVAYSANDGGSWTRIELTANVVGNAMRVTAHAGTFIAAAVMGRVFKSPSGAPGTWAQVTTGLAGNVGGIASGLGYIMMVRQSSTETAISIDGGASFTAGPTLPTASSSDLSLSSNVLFDGNQFVVALNNGKFAIGTGGAWTEVGALPHRASSLAYGLPGVPVADAPGYYVALDGSIVGPPGCTVATSLVSLAFIVGDLCQRGGLTSDEYDVSQLAGIMVHGFRIASEGDPASAIGALAAAYRFDCGEWDGKMRFVLRGGTPVLSLGIDDIIERDGDPIEWVRKQEAELLRKVTVAYLDPAADYTPMTQQWERRTATIQAKGEQSTEIPVVMPGDDAATIAEVRGLIGWAETETAKLSLPYRRTALTPTDVILITDTDNTEHRIRLEQIEEDSGVLFSEATLDGGTVYSATAVGVRPPPRTITDPGVIGPTTLHVMDLPVWDTDSNDEPGAYVAVRGLLGGWSGAALQISTDNGASWITAANFTTPANIGYTTTALLAWGSAEYPSAQSVTVYLPAAPVSVTRDAILNNRNRAAIRNDSGAWEIIQYQTVADHGDNTYTLSGLVRGRYATTPGPASASSAFVLLNETTPFVRMERAYLGQPLTVRAVSFGTVPENSANVPVTVSGVSQTEWPPHMVTATRDSGTNDVTVTWVERRRLGTEIAPFNGKYHNGFRVTYSDGQSYDVAAGVFTHTRSAAPSSQTITVQALNTITGAGQSSEAVTV